MKLAVVTDSTAFLSDEVKQKENLFVISIPVILDGQIYQEGIDIKANDYYSLLKSSKEFPTTSQPALGEMLDLYQSIANQGYDTIISIHLSSGISGFVNNLQSIASSVEGLTIYSFDSLITSSPMGHMVAVALEMGEEGRSIEEILQRLTEIKEHSSAYLIVNDLNNLVRGGRLTNGAALIGSLLKIKPILTFTDGKIVVFEKIRSSKKAFSRVEKLIGEQIKKSPYPLKFFVIHGNDLETAEKEKEALQKKYPEIDVQISYFGPVIGTHLGEKAIGIGWSPQ